MNIKMFQSELEALLKKERRQEAYKAIIEACNDAEHSEMAVESITEVTFRLLNKEREKQVEQLVIKYLINNNEHSSECTIKDMDEYAKEFADRSMHEIGSAEHYKAIVYSVAGVGYVDVIPPCSTGEPIRILVAGKDHNAAQPHVLLAVIREIDKHASINDEVIVEGVGAR